MPVFRNTKTSKSCLLTYLAPFVLAYDDLIGGPLAQYLRLSGSIGGLVQQQADMVTKAVQIQRQFLVLASSSQRPNDQDLMNLLKPTADQITAIQDLRNRYDSPISLWHEFTC